MKINRVRWVSIKSDWDGEFCVAIQRGEFNINRPCPGYRPTAASARRVRRLAEQLSGKYQVALGFGELTKRLNIQIMLNLPRTS